MKLINQNTKQRDRLSVALLTVACLGSTCLSSVAFAQAQQSAQATELEQIVVTGSRVVRDGYQAPTPVSVIGIEQLDNVATSNLADSINQLPAIVNSATPQSSSVNTTSGQSAINALSLRGLGISRTLVLLNGQRTVGSNLTGAVDISELPQGLIERVDVVTGGASAAYGSDALSGVVNFVLDTDFVGFKGEVSGGLTTYGDVPNYKINATYGTEFAGGRGHFLAYGEHVWDEGLLVYDRPWALEGHSYVNNPAFAPGNGQPSVIRTSQTGIGNAAWGGMFVGGPLAYTAFGPGGVPYQVSPGDLPPGALLRGGSWKAQDVIGTRGAAAQPRQNRQDVFTRLSYDINDNVNVYAQAAWGHLGSYSSGAPNFFPGNLTLQTNNAYLPADMRAALEADGSTSFRFGTLNEDLDNFRAVYDRRVQRFLVGAEGDIDFAGTNWDWDAHASYGKMFGTLKSKGAIDRTRYPKAVNSVLVNGAPVCSVNADADTTNDDPLCVPYNPFGTGVNSAAAVDYLQGRYGWNVQRLIQKVAAVNFAGEPFSTWAGPVSVAFGYEYRNEKMRQISDPEEQANPTIWFQAAGQPYTGSFTVHDIYAEAVVPLATNQPWAESLDINGAIRGTDYSTYGSVVTYKVGGTYAPTDEVRFRLTQSRNIRSPTLVDLFQAGSTSRSSSTDPFNNNAVINSQITTSGNPNLGPEKSNDIGFGVVYQPEWFDGFNVSVDYYRIKIKDAVNLVGSQDLINFCFQGNQTACSQIQRVGAGTAGEQLNITTGPQNFATEKAEGIDIEASYTLPLEMVSNSFNGTLGMRVLATHFLSYETFSGIPGDAVIEYAGVTGGGAGLGGGGTGIPNWKINASLQYALDPLDLGLTFRWISAGINNAQWIECQTNCPAPSGAAITTDDNSVASALYVDFNAAYTIQVGETAETELFLNIRNLANADPSIAVRGPGGSSWDFAPTPSGGAFDVLGRVFRAGVKFRM